MSFYVERDVWALGPKCGWLLVTSAVAECLVKGR